MNEDRGSYLHIIRSSILNPRYFFIFLATIPQFPPLTPINSTWQAKNMETLWQDLRFGFRQLLGKPCADGLFHSDAAGDAGRSDGASSRRMNMPQRGRASCPVPNFCILARTKSRIPCLYGQPQRLDCYNP